MALFQTLDCYYFGYCCYFCYSKESMHRDSFKQLLSTQARTTHDTAVGRAAPHASPSSCGHSQSLLCPGAELMVSCLSPVLSTSSQYLSRHHRDSPYFVGENQEVGTCWFWGGPAPSPGPAPLHFSRVQAGREWKGLETEGMFD